MRLVGTRKFYACVAVAVLLGACGGERVPLALEEDRCAPDAAWPEVHAEFGAEILRLTNQHRASIGAPPLTVSPALQRGADWKARHMAAYDYMTHNDPAPPIERGTFDRFRDCGYSGSAAENICKGYATPEEAFQGWLDSSGHRSNLENSKWNIAGMAVAYDADDTPHWVQMFGYSSSTATTGPSASPGVTTTPAVPGGSPQPDATSAPEEVFNAPPVAANETVTTRPGRQVTVNLVANDSDPDGDRLGVSLSSVPRFAASFEWDSEGMFSYRARRGTVGRTERLTYTLEDGRGGTATATLTIRIR
ncbi:MAG TPA: CAP domain-containing protein [Actinomycetota bacterium]|nr:CAP domain-containing protein [Actinomycetota bacterium]